MNIALFAARSVGYEVARFFGEKKEKIACLVLDSNDRSGLNLQIMEASGVSQDCIFYSSDLYHNETLNYLNENNLDLIILAWWPYILKEQLIKIPRIGCLNFHNSYLPYNRGKNPNFWSIVENFPYGVTLHFIDSGIDSGDIAYQAGIEKNWEDTGETLYIRGLQEIIRLFKDKFYEIKNGQIPRKKQDLIKGSFHKSSELEMASRIELDKAYKARELLDLLRARTFRPHPGAWFLENGERYEVRVEIKKANKTEDDKI